MDKCKQVSWSSEANLRGHLVAETLPERGETVHPVDWPGPTKEGVLRSQQAAVWKDTLGEKNLFVKMKLKRSMSRSGWKPSAVSRKQWKEQWKRTLRAVPTKHCYPLRSHILSEIWNDFRARGDGDGPGLNSVEKRWKAKLATSTMETPEVDDGDLVPYEGQVDATDCIHAEPITEEEKDGVDDHCEGDVEQSVQEELLGVLIGALMHGQPSPQAVGRAATCSPELPIYGWGEDTSVPSRSSTPAAPPRVDSPAA